ncbi:N-acetylmuramoyl-L-alanine amidase [Clostridiales Family XIII bacterium ASD5510]|uniref:N-acetylmuramoyl-L-alanine amidase n=1 Tax=Hominibacterium faecale TaxID=2839743 RepID=A0A9J6R020_9FIRM|nr:N-acetylmuramoyl-L-alanine amidase [Hominibacterium faecale]MCU7381063.1 N-acetylmuramoyl-L-alanine amidase [Hominibacterium faecale]
MAKIAIDAGHGRYTPGKRCMKKLDRNETREWVLNDRVADELGRLLKAAGHTVKRMDDTDGSTDVSLAARVQKANAWGADFYISVHHNSGVGGSSGGGTEVYVSKGCQAKSKKAQAAIYKYAIKRADLKGNRADGTRTANFYVIRYTDMPACLIECGFMDSKVDIKYILDPAWSKKIALGIAEGICEVFGGTIKAGSGSGGSITPKPAPSKPAPAKPAEKYKLDVDGSWGKDCTRKSQKVLKTTIDGIVSNQPVGNKKYLPNVYTGSWEFTSNYKGGSALIKAVQKLIGAKVDGWCGKQTVITMQKFLRAKGLYAGEIDGSMGPKTVKAWQKYINSRL